MDNHEQRLSHRAEKSKSHQKVRHSLFDNSLGCDYRAANLGPIPFCRGDYTEFRLIDGERVSMHGRLGN